MKKYLIITCSSFTAIVLLFALFSTFDMAPKLSKSIVLQLFTMSISISLLMFISDRMKTRFDIDSLAVDALIRMLICYIVVFFEGSFFRMFPFAWKSMISISIVLIPAYVITYAIGYLTIVDCANTINKRIKRKF